MLPLFLDELEGYPALEPSARGKPTPLFFIFHLLGEWREEAAYRPLARLLILPDDEIDTIFGDGITTTSPRVGATLRFLCRGACVLASASVRALPATGRRHRHGREHRNHQTLPRPLA